MNIIRLQKGFSIVELMIATSIGFLLSLAVTQIYLAQTQVYKTSNSQDLIQSSQNAISYLVTPVIRAAGFTGCSTISTAVSNLNAGGPNPLGSMGTDPTMIRGYSGGTTAFTISANPANSSTASDWTPALDSTLVGNAQRGSDVLVVFGAAPGYSPLSITTIANGSNAFTVQSTAGTSITSGQYGAVSDCTKTTIFQITGVTGNSIAHNSGGSALQNASSAFPVNYQVGSQFMVLQQTAFFVGQSQGGQSALMRATLNGTTWTVQPLVPGVETMKVLYGIGSNGTVTQYVPANLVTNWAQVYAVRIGFLIAGQSGSGTNSSERFSVLDVQMTVPSDNRLRHVFEMTIHLRNALS